MIKEYCEKRYDEELEKFNKAGLYEEKVICMAKMQILKEIIDYENGK